MPNVLVTTAPFGDINPLPINLLNESGISYTINPLRRKLRENELIEMIPEFDALIAGTEEITENVLKHARRLKHISRVGVGLDSVDLAEAKKRGIVVSYTPDAPTPAVAELTISLILSLLRHTHMANSQMHAGKWNRYFGRCISDTSIGIIGVGRIGRKVINLLLGFGVKEILVNDILPEISDLNTPLLKWVEKDELYRKADVITLHVPLTANTYGMVGYEQLRKMRSDAVIINTSRGGIVNELDLKRIMQEGHLSGAAIDVFENEPYAGELCDVERCLLTSHMGSMSIECRSRMEIEATEECIRFFNGQPLQGLVPSEEYILQLRGI